MNHQQPVKWFFGVLSVEVSSSNIITPGEFQVIKRKTMTLCLLCQSFPKFPCREDESMLFCQADLRDHGFVSKRARSIKYRNMPCLCCFAQTSFKCLIFLNEFRGAMRDGFLR